MALSDPRYDGRRQLAGLVVAAGVLAAVAIVWWWSSPVDEVTAARRRFAELEQHIASAREGQGARATMRGQVLRLQAQARASEGAQRAAFERQAAAAEARLAWGDPAAVRGVVLGRPLLALSSPVRNDGASSPAGSPPDAPRPDPLATAAPGCRACHVAIDTAGYEQYPQPFRTHPQLSAYVGNSSPHPSARVECTACHGGSEDGTTVSAAGHPLDERGIDVAALESAAAVPRMLPVRQTEAGCATCHHGERYLPGAEALDAAYTAFERGGCFACHVAPGFDVGHKRGPDLRRVRGKLTPEWVQAWLRNPRGLKRDAMMPRFWGRTAGPEPSEPSDVVIAPEDEQEIAAVAAYLFANAEPYVPAPAGSSRGDAARGGQIVQAVGCLGCHIVGNEPDQQVSLRRTFGQPLQNLAGKVSYAWLHDWIRRPSRFSPATLMPDLRLTDAEAADVATYLLSLGGADRVAPPDVRRSDAAMREQARRQGEFLPPILRGSANLDALSGEALHIELGRRVIARQGCFNCHEIRGFESAPRTDAPLGPARLWSSDDVARLHATANGAAGEAGGLRAPAYAINERARQQFALAVTAVQRPPADSRNASSPGRGVRVAGRRLVQRRNCVGCHAIEGTGGDFVRLVAEPSLGPPLLTPEGSRVQPAWLDAFLHGPITIRPWLSVRMPTFQFDDGESEQIGGYFRAIAPPNPVPAAAAPSVTAAAGRELFELLKCQQCHVLATIPKDQPTSNLAPDLRMGHERLQPEWILAWLRNPSDILPGTRMPAYWPDYPQSFYPPFERDGALQVQAIRDHLLTLRGGPTPVR